MSRLHQVDQLAPVEVCNLPYENDLVHLLTAKLPFDVWALVFPRLPSKVREALRGTCKALRDLCDRASTSLELGCFREAYVPDASRRAGAFVRRLPLLRSLAFTHFFRKPPDFWIGPPAGGLFGPEAPPLQAVTTLQFTADGDMPMTVQQLRQLLGRLPNLRSALFDDAALLPESFGEVAAESCKHLAELALVTHSHAPKGAFPAESAEVDTGPADGAAHSAAGDGRSSASSENSVQLADASALLHGCKQIQMLRRLECRLDVDRRGGDAAAFHAVGELAALESLSWRCTTTISETTPEDVEEYGEADCDGKCSRRYPNTVWDLRAITALTSLTRLELPGLEACALPSRGNRMSLALAPQPLEGPSTWSTSCRAGSVAWRARSASFTRLRSS